MDVASQTSLSLLSRDSLFPSSELARWNIQFVHQAMMSRSGLAAWSDGWLSVHADDGSRKKFHLSLTDTADFFLDFSGKTIRINASGAWSPEGMRHLLGDQILPRILAHQGQLVLHAAAACRDAGMFLLVGPSGSGKSTLAASLHNSNYHLVGDDAIVVSDEVDGMSGRAVYRSLRLFPDSIRALVHSPADLRPVASYTAKQNVVFADGDRSDQPLPLRAAFVLNAPDGDRIAVERITPSEACMTFVEHSFWLDPTDFACAKKRMVKASALAERVPTFHLTYPREYDALPAVHDVLAGMLD